jgi:hypothetical protein
MTACTIPPPLVLLLLVLLLLCSSVSSACTMRIHVGYSGAHDCVLPHNNCTACCRCYCCCCCCRVQCAAVLSSSVSSVTSAARKAQCRSSVSEANKVISFCCSVVITVVVAVFVLARPLSYKLSLLKQHIRCIATLQVVILLNVSKCMPSCTRDLQ